MKVFVVLNNPDSLPMSKTAWYMLADSSVSNTGKPFYMPENLGPTVASLCLVVRINRLGKGIREKFASRYYAEYAPAIHFYLPEYGIILRQHNLPEDASKNFDKSLIVGEFRKLEEGNQLELWVNGELRTKKDIKSDIDKVNKIITDISVLNTLKIGDLIVPDLGKEMVLGENDMIEVKIDGEISFVVRIK